MTRRHKTVDPHQMFWCKGWGVLCCGNGRRWLRGHFGGSGGPIVPEKELTTENTAVATSPYGGLARVGTRRYRTWRGKTRQAYSACPDRPFVNLV